MSYRQPYSTPAFVPDSVAVQKFSIMKSVQLRGGKPTSAIIAAWLLRHVRHSVAVVCRLSALRLVALQS